MSISESIDKIVNYSHFWNWSPEWLIFKEVYKAFPDSYSVLTPFAYSYLEELIRSTTSEYGNQIFDKNGIPKKRRVGIKLIKLAIEENKPNNHEFVNLLEEMKKYFSPSQIIDEGDNRNSVAHGYMPPRYWSKESFEKLIDDIARLSKFSGF